MLRPFYNKCPTHLIFNINEYFLKGILNVTH